MLASLLSVRNLVIGSVSLALVLMAGTAWAEGARARVSGVRALTLRDGPGTEYKALSWIAEGESVEVEERAAAWAKIRTQSGAQGYVHTRYLEDLHQQTVPLAMADEGVRDRSAPVAPDAGTEPVSVQPHGAAAAGGADPELGRMIAGTGADAHSGAAASRDLVDVRAELQQLLQRTEQMQRQLTAYAQREGQPLPVGSDSTAAWALFGIGLLFGAFFGAAFGRRQERNRRTRIRL